MIKQFIKDCIADPLEAIGSFLLLMIISLLFYVSMWIFY